MSSTSTSKVWSPHPYQERAVKIMIQQGAAGLLLDPGLGKTSCTLSAFVILKKSKHVKRLLVVAPLRPVYDVWPAEIEKWANFNHLTYAILHGPDKNWLVDNPEDVDVFLINPEGLAWLMGTAKKPDFSKLRKLGVDMIVIDESTKFKHTNTNRFKLLRKALEKNIFRRRYILTGTVVPNGLEDLFGQIFILDSGNALGRYITHFRVKYFHQPDPADQPYLWEATPGAREQIADRISPLTLQLSAEDYLRMPELQFFNIEVTLPDEAMQHYQEVENEFITAIGEDVLVASNAAVAGTKCRQIANGAVYTSENEWHEIHTAKLDALEDLVEELSGAPLLVLYEYRHDLERLRAKYPFAAVVGSGVSQKKTSEILADFNAGRIPILFGHPASMGHGLNLQGSCHHVCWFGITWNYEFYDQAIARVYRQGQKSKTVFVYHIVAKGTLDEKVLRALDKKERVELSLFDVLVAPV